MKKARFFACGICCVVAIVFSACGKGTSPTANQAANVNTTGAASGSPVSSANAGMETDPSKYDANIARLEQQAAKSPGDETTRDALSQAYLQRANAQRNAGQFREALHDYQSALRYNPDNEEAQQRVAEIVEQMGGEPPAENNEPAPLPISPGTVATDDEPSGAKQSNPRSKKPEKP